MKVDRQVAALLPERSQAQDNQQFNIPNPSSAELENILGKFVSMAKSGMLDLSGISLSKRGHNGSRSLQALTIFWSPKE